jgi:hypothetical protein
MTLALPSCPHVYLCSLQHQQRKQEDQCRQPRKLASGLDPQPALPRGMQQHCSWSCSCAVPFAWHAASPCTKLVAVAAAVLLPGSGDRHFCARSGMAAAAAPCSII